MSDFAVPTLLVLVIGMLLHYIWLSKSRSPSSSTATHQQSQPPQEQPEEYSPSEPPPAARVPTTVPPPRPTPPPAPCLPHELCAETRQPSYVKMCGFTYFDVGGRTRKGKLHVCRAEVDANGICSWRTLCGTDVNHSCAQSHSFVFARATLGFLCDHVLCDHPGCQKWYRTSTLDNIVKSQTNSL
jgi:hypothetical protein